MNAVTQAPIDLRRHAVDRLSAGSIDGLRALMDRPVEEDTLPLGLHWTVAVPRAPQASLGPDGHPAEDGFLPDLGLPRRMWGGCRTRLLAPARPDAAIELSETVAAVEEKEGAGGRMAIVRVDRSYTADGASWIEESLDVLYLGGRARNGGASPEPVEIGAALADTTVVPTTTLLFRYSALTFNAHRIHYDRDYAVGTEGYPDLVVHGPLIATLLMNTARDALGADPANFRIRLQSPAFVDRPIRLAWIEEDDGIRGFALDLDGRPHATAVATRIAGD